MSSGLQPLRGLRIRTVLACFARAPAFAPCCANACAVFRSCALRVLAPSPLRGLAYWRAGTARHISGLRPPNCLGLVGLWPPSRRRGVPALRTPFGRVLAPPAASRPSTAHFVCSPLQPFGPPMFASSLAAFLALLGSSYRPALRWPGIPGRRSRLRGWHRVTLRNQPCLKEKRQGWFCFSFILPPWRTSRYR